MPTDKSCIALLSIPLTIAPVCICPLFCLFDILFVYSLVDLSKFLAGQFGPILGGKHKLLTFVSPPAQHVLNIRDFL